jgi:hypothetical protein
MAKSQYTKEELITSIIDMRLNKSASVRFILEFLMKDLNYSKSQAYQYIKWAREEITETYKQNNEAAVEESVGQLEDAMQWARTNKNFKLWFELRKELNKIRGNYATEKVDITSAGKALPTEVVVKIINNNETGD